MQNTQAHKVNPVGITALLGILCAFAPFSIDMYLAAFPTIAEEFGTDQGKVQLTLSVFFVGLALGQLLYGPLIDRIGRRLPLLAGLMLYCTASIGIALVPNIEAFIVLRFLQAVGGCAGMIISRAVIRDLFDVNASARVLSLMMVVQSVGPIAAPVLGGYLMTFATWHVAFYGMALLGLGTFCAAFIFLPETLAPEKRVKQNILDVLKGFIALLRNGSFTVPTVAGGLTGACIFAFISGSPFVFMNLHGLSKEEYGWAFTFIAVGMTVGSQANTILLRYFKAKTLMLACIYLNAVFALGLVLFGQSENFWLLYALIMLTQFFMPAAVANSTAIAMGSSMDKAGSASALLGVLQFTFAGIISALTGYLHDGTAMSMCVMMLACGVGGILTVGVGRFYRVRY